MNQSSGVGLVRDSTKPSSRWTVGNRDANFGTDRSFCKSRGVKRTRWDLRRSGRSVGNHAAIWAAQPSRPDARIRSTLGDNEHLIAIHHASAVRGEVRYDAHDIDVFRTNGAESSLGGPFRKTRPLRIYCGSRSPIGPTAQRSEIESALREIGARIRRNEEAATQ